MSSGRSRRERPGPQRSGRGGGGGGGGGGGDFRGRYYLKQLESGHSVETWAHLIDCPLFSNDEHNVSRFTIEKRLNILLSIWLMIDLFDCFLGGARMHARRPAPDQLWNSSKQQQPSFIRCDSWWLWSAGRPPFYSVDPPTTNLRRSAQRLRFQFHLNRLLTADTFNCSNSYERAPTFMNSNGNLVCDSLHHASIQGVLHSMLSSAHPTQSAC